MGIGFKELLIILAIALLVFGAKRVKTLGSDLGGAVRGFRKAMDDSEEKEAQKLNSPEAKDAEFEASPDKSDSRSGQA